MSPSQDEPIDPKARYLRYPSPSRDAVETPVKRALRLSKNRADVFIENFHAYNKEASLRFQKGMQKLTEERDKKEGKENSEPL